MVAGEDARFAAMVVLERLTPDQRVAFVLHDGFAVPFGEIASVLGVSDAAARQLASRARRAVASAPEPVPDDAHNEVAGALMAALAAGDMDAVVRLLHPEVTFTGDSNRRAPTAARVIHGPDKVARFLFGLAQRYGPNFLATAQLALVNGQLGSYTPGAPAGDGYPEMMPRVTAMTVRDGKICAIWDVANPDKFTLRRSAVLRRPWHPAGVARAEALLGDAERRVHPGPHVLHADLVGQLDHSVVAEAAPQIVDLFVGDGVRVGGHRIGVGDGGPLVVGVGAARSRSCRCP